MISKEDTIILTYLFLFVACACSVPDGQYWPRAGQYRRPHTRYWSHHAVPQAVA